MVHLCPLTNYEIKRNQPRPLIPPTRRRRQRQHLEDIKLTGANLSGKGVPLDAMENLNIFGGTKHSAHEQSGYDG